MKYFVWLPQNWPELKGLPTEDIRSRYREALTASLKDLRLYLGHALTPLALLLLLFIHPSLSLPDWTLFPFLVLLAILGSLLAGQWQFFLMRRYLRNKYKTTA